MKHAQHHRLVALGMLATLGGACGERFEAPREQWLLTVSTDAQVPGFGSRLMIDVSDADGISAEPFERRVFDVGETSAWPVSFGIVPGVASLLRVRARLFRPDHVGIRGEPEGDSIFDVTALLPELESDTGIRRVELPLPMACFGKRADLSQHTSCSSVSGELESEPTLTAAGRLDVGSWPPGIAKPCEGEVPNGMICQPGGAYFLGASSQGADPFAEIVTPVRLVQLSPFALDEDEMTVGVVRKLIANGELPDSGIRRDDGDTDCTYLGDGDDSHDRRPLNCVLQSVAARVCELLGKRLPTETEWEYAAGNLSDKTAFPWGDDTDICAHSVVARSVLSGDGFCIVGTKVQAAAAGGHPKDLTELGVRNLGGNVSEWTADISARYDSGCWPAEERLRIDPVCTAAGAENQGPAIRGGTWNGAPDLARVSRRRLNAEDQALNSVGFRCALSLGGSTP